MNRWICDILNNVFFTFKDVKKINITLIFLYKPTSMLDVFNVDRYIAQTDIEPHVCNFFLVRLPNCWKIQVCYVFNF